MLIILHHADINECEEEIDACAQDCTDTEGSYNCSCRTGYTLASDNLGCDGKNMRLSFWHEYG